MKQTKMIKSYNFYERLKRFSLMLVITSVSFGAAARVAEDAVEVDLAASVQQTIRGVVTDENNLPIPGVNVVIKGTATGSSTDFDGNYAISASKGDVLQFTYVGYTTQEITVGDATTINVSLKESLSELDEVVLIGYGSESKADVSGAVGAVKSEQLLVAPVASVSNALAGRIAGVYARSSAGVPGNDATGINVRGFGTPEIFVIDGVTFSGSGAFNRLDPNDIESVTVLKDAAAAVYGVQGGNGVVLVKTKRGSASKPTITLNTNTTFQTPTFLPTKVDSWDYVALQREGASNIGLDPDGEYLEEDIEKYKNGEPGYVNTDWYDVIYKDITPMIQHNLGLRGGTEDVKYFTSLGLQDQHGAFRSGDLNFKRYNVRSNLDVNISDDLTMRMDLSYTKELRDSPGQSVGTIYNHLETTKPMYPAVLPDPDRAAWGGFQPRAPYAATQKRFSGFDDDVQDRFVGIMSLDYKLPFLKGLSAELKMNYTMRQKQVKLLRKPYDIWRYDYENDEYIGQGTSNVSSVEERYNAAMQIQPSFFVKYKNKFGKHSIDAFAGVETRDIENESFFAKRINLLSSDIPYLNFGNEEGQTNGGSASEEGWKSYVGRAIYKYKNKYIVNFTMRADAVAHKFPEDTRWGYFPSASVAWKISEEGFLKGSNAVDLLKLRTSYSVSGSTAGVDNWRFLSGFQPSTSTYLIDGGSGATIYNIGLPNDQITWRENRISNIGLDGSFWNGLLGFELDVFYREVANRFEANTGEYPYTFSFGLPQLNTRVDSNRGFDIMLTHKNRINDDLSYNVNAMFSWNRARIDKTLTDNLLDVSAIDPADFPTEEDYQTAVDQANQFNYINQREGQWTNRYFGYVSDGQFQSQEQIDNHPVDQDQNGNTSLLPGDIIYKDLDGDGVITSLDQDIIGFGGTANINFGLDLGLTYKAFSVSALFQGATNVNKMITGAARSPFGNSQSVPFDYHLKHRFVYDADLDANTNPNASMPMIASTGGMENNTKTSDFWLQDASYVRLKALNLTYSVPTNLLDKIGCSRLDIIASGTNLVTWSKLGIFKDTFDPESGFSANGRQYPIMKTYSFGLNIAF